MKPILFWFGGALTELACKPCSLSSWQAMTMR
jgi:hypothetical protein